MLHYSFNDVCVLFNTRGVMAFILLHVFTTGFTSSVSLGHSVCHPDTISLSPLQLSHQFCNDTESFSTLHILHLTLVLKELIGRSLETHHPRLSLGCESGEALPFSLTIC